MVDPIEPSFLAAEMTDDELVAYLWVARARVAVAEAESAAWQRTVEFLERKIGDRELLFGTPDDPGGDEE